MNNDIYIIGEIGVNSPQYMNTTLKELVESVALSDKKKPLNVYIQTVGGGVYEGKAMRKLLKSLSIQPNTISMGLVASVGTIIFLAGNKETRKINSNDDFLIHLPMGGAEGNAVDLEKAAAELRVMEGEFADIYAEETSLTKEEALSLMKKDEMLHFDILQGKGFVSEIIEFKAVAKLDNNNNKQMTEKDEKGFLDRMETMIAKYFKKETPTNKIVTDAVGVELDFTELEADATPANGDTAQVDGANAEGDYLMPSGETFKFVDGVLEIMPAAEEENEDNTEALQAEIAELKEKLEGATASISEKDELIASKDVKLTNVEKDLKDFKAEITSKFEYDGKKKKKEEDDRPTNRVSSYKTIKNK